MAVTHAFRRALRLDLDRAAEAFALVDSHLKIPFAVGGMTSRVRSLFAHSTGGLNDRASASLDAASGSIAPVRRGVISVQFRSATP